LFAISDKQKQALPWANNRIQKMLMKKNAAILLGLFCLLNIRVNAQQPTPFFKKGDRVCFIGNSITHNGEFHHNIYQYYVTRFPKQPISFFNAGIKGDVTGGILKRIDTDVMIHKPTHAVIMIGMNDVQRELYGKSITQNADTLARRKSALDLYSTNLDSIVRVLLKKGVKVILQKPSAYDQTSTIKYPNNLGVNDALIGCGAIMQKLADKYRLPTIDYGSIMTSITRQIQEKNPAATLTVNDRVHPGSIGHFIMSYQFLKATNASSTVANIVIDVKKLNNKTANTNCSVKKTIYKKNVLTLHVLENALPFLITDNQQPAVALVPFTKELNNEILQVLHLEKGNYQLLIDSIVIDNFSNEALQQGINLAMYKKTPQYQQALKVQKTLEMLWENEANYRAVAFVEYTCLQSFAHKNDMAAAKKYLDSLYTVRFKGQSYYSKAFEKYITYKPQMTRLLQQADSLRTLVYAQAQPVAHTFTIQRAEAPSVAALIEASQSGAMPLLFDVQSKYLVTEMAAFNSDKEFYLRNSLPNFFCKINQQSPSLTIGFLGGSITKAEDQYRNQTLAFIQSLNPNAKIKGINAGVSGTGTELGACRIKEQVLKYNPDLVFVEFAVNGGSNQALEGIVRQTILHNPKTDICFLYTIAGEQYLQYAKNIVPAKIQAFEKVADYYQIPSIHMGLYPSALAAQGNLLWKSSSEVGDKIVFSKDGTHPAKAGGDLYAQAIARAFHVFKNHTAIRKFEMPAPLYTDNWQDGGMYAPAEIGTFSAGWESINPSAYPHLKGFAPWFATIYKAAEPNAGFTFKFKGTAFGFFDIGGPEAGQVLVEIDGNCAALTRKAGNAANNLPNETGFKCINNRFNANCNNRYRGQFEMFDVPGGEHEVKITLSNLHADKLAILQGQDLTDIQENPDKYNQQVFYLGKILVKGTIINK
jgi:lysophospholipase L1-like esterase